MIWSVFKIGVRIDKNKRIGEKSINNYGFVMTIIDYIDCNNVTIQFEDGEIVENIYYYKKSRELEIFSNSLHLSLHIIHCIIQ